ncbi:MAG: DNA polymerase III subunit delta, partial [Verrucomicrobiota bacterium]
HLFITGNDEFQVSSRVKSLVDELAPEDKMNLEVIDGRAENVEQACRMIEQWQEAILTLPFLGGRKLIYVKSATFFQDSVIGRSESVQQRLEGILTHLESVGAESVQSLVGAPGADKRKRFYKNFAKVGVCEIYDAVELRNAASIDTYLTQVRKLLREKGIQFEPGVPEAMMELVGNQSRALHSELEKLSLYARPDETITEEELREIVSSSQALLVWDLCDAVTEGQTNQATYLVRQLLAQGESEVGILILLSNQIRLAALLSWMREAGHARLESKGRSKTVSINPSVTDLLPVTSTGKSPSPYRMGRILSKSAGKSSRTWFRALERLYQTHFKLVGGTSDRARALETMIIEICESS